MTAHLLKHLSFVQLANHMRCLAIPLLFKSAVLSWDNAVESKKTKPPTEATTDANIYALYKPLRPTAGDTKKNSTANSHNHLICF